MQCSIRGNNKCLFLPDAVRLARDIIRIRIQAHRRAREETALKPKSESLAKINKNTMESKNDSGKSLASIYRAESFVTQSERLTFQNSISRRRNARIQLSRMAKKSMTGKSEPTERISNIKTGGNNKEKSNSPLKWAPCINKHRRGLALELHNPD